MIVIKETAVSFIKHINEKSRQYVVTAAAITTVLAILICLLFSGTTISYNIIYDGKVVAQVKDKAVYEEAFQSASKLVASDNAEALLSQAEIKPTLIDKSGFNTQAELTDIILDNSDKLQKGYIVNVDGKQALFLEGNKEVKTALDSRLSKYNTVDKSCISDFAKEVLVEAAYFEASLLSTDDEMSAYVDTLDVVTVITDTETQKVPYDTIVKKSSSKNAGYSIVTTKGKDGLKLLSKQLTLLNGEKTDEEVLSEEIIEEPVDEVVVVGTASASKGTANKYATSGSFVYPTDKKANITVTSYWGDGRNHKAVDIAGPVGTKIFASLSGTVVNAGYSNDYGYSVLIDHGNGMQTRYAHCSKLYVKAGEKVSAGQTIALMGSTGYSTGSHLHFEVILNGKRVDPAPYIGLY